jgi:hypothetical protein
VAALARAVAATRERPSLWIVALCGFLARGGIVLLIVPLVPLPSTVGMATFVGPTSVTAAGLTPDGIVRVALVVALAVGWLVAGSLVGALTDRAAVRTVAWNGDVVERGGRRVLLRLAGLRLIALVPLIAVVAIAARSVGELVYQELILPSDISAPIVLRVVQGARLQVIAIALAWVAGEVLGGIAVRLVVLEDRSIGQAIGSAVAFVVRHPLATLVATVAGLGGLLVAIAVALVAIGAAWASLAEAVSGPIDGAALIRTTILLVAAWAASAALVAIVAAWRGAVWTIALDRMPFSRA